MTRDKNKKKGAKPLTKEDQTILTKLGLAFAELRTSTGDSSENFANKNDLARTWYGEVERGKKNIFFLTFLKLLNKYNITPIEFFTEWEELTKRGAARKEDAKKKANKK